MRGVREGSIKSDGREETKIKKKKTRERGRIKRKRENKED